MSAPRFYNRRTFETAVRLAQAFPPAWLNPFAEALGGLAARQMPKIFAVQRENLRMVTGLQGADLDRFCEKNFSLFARSLSDYCRALPLDATTVGHEFFEVMEGREHMESARASGRGAVLATAHLGCWELGGHLMAWLDFPLSIVTLREPCAELNEWRGLQRQRIGVQTITIGENPLAFVEMLTALRAGRFLAMLVDRPRPESALEVDWTGKRTRISTGPALLAAKAGVPVIPVFIVMTCPGRYRGVALPPLPPPPDDSPASISLHTQQLSSVVESMVRRLAGQWFNYTPIFHSDG